MLFGDSDENDLYDAMDWVLMRPRIEKKLAARHLKNDALVLLTSGYDAICTLVACNRDGKKGKRQVSYGLLTNARGTPVAVSIFNVAMRKVHTRTLEDGSETHSFRSLLAELGTIFRNECRVVGKSSGGLDLETMPDVKQRRALLKTIGTNA